MSIIDEIGPWTEVKLEIIRKYAQAYSTILARRARFRHVYIDAFAGTGIHVSKTSGEFVPGSPTNALNLRPEFAEYHFIDIDRQKVKVLETLSTRNPDKIRIYQGDCNEILLNAIFPRIQYNEYRRGLCLLDPYGLDLGWKILQKAGEMKSIEVFYSLFISDMNRNVLWRNPEKVSKTQIKRLDFVWGDNSWRDVVYRSNGNLFSYLEKDEDSNNRIAQAFRLRLTNKAGFKYVPQPMPMRNSKGNILYYLYFASPNKTANKIVQDIFDKYANKGL
jgi:three-Cys-motif partner protein